MANPGLFLFIFGLFNQIIQFLQQGLKMPFQNPVLGFELTTSWIWVSALNH